MTKTFRITCTKIVNDRPVSYVETVYAKEVGHFRWVAESDMWGTSKVFPSARTASLGLASQACASVRKCEEEA